MNPYLLFLEFFIQANAYQKPGQVMQQIQKVKESLLQSIKENKCYNAKYLISSSAKGAQPKNCVEYALS